MKAFGRAWQVLRHGLGEENTGNQKCAQLLASCTHPVQYQPICAQWRLCTTEGKPLVVRACVRAWAGIQVRVPLQWLMPCFLLVAWVAVGVAHHAPTLCNKCSSQWSEGLLRAGGMLWRSKLWFGSFFPPGQASPQAQCCKGSFKSQMKKKPLSQCRI